MTRAPWTTERCSVCGGGFSERSWNERHTDPRDGVRDCHARCCPHPDCREVQREVARDRKLVAEICVRYDLVPRKRAVQPPLGCILFAHSGDGVTGTGRATDILPDQANDNAPVAPPLECARVDRKELT
jgi:hypothetical protein